MTVEPTSRHCIKCFRIVTSTDVEVIETKDYGKLAAYHMSCPHCGRKWVAYGWDTEQQYTYPNGDPNK